MSGQDDDEEQQPNYCVDCCGGLCLDESCHWPELGPICYGCLADRLEKAEARIATLEQFLRQVVADNEDSQYPEDAHINLQLLAEHAQATLGVDK